MSARYPNRDDECVYPLGAGVVCKDFPPLFHGKEFFHQHNVSCSERQPEHKPTDACHPVMLPEPE